VVIGDRLSIYQYMVNSVGVARVWFCYENTMGRGNIGIIERRDEYKLEKIRVLKEKYGAEVPEQEDDGEYHSLVITEEIEVTDEVDIKFSGIHQELNPCIDELFRIQRDIEHLKQKFKSPLAYVEHERRQTEENEDEKEITKHENKTDISEVSVQFARMANERDIQHMVCDTKGNEYILGNMVMEVDKTGKERYKPIEKRKGYIECEVKAGMMMSVKVTTSDDNLISVGGIDCMRQLGLTREDLQACIDSVKTRGGHQMCLIGERVVAIRGDNKRTLTRVVFITGVKGLHLSWYIARELGV